MSNSKAKLIIRNATPDDIPGLQALSAKVYGEGEEYSRDHLMAQINRFPDGQFVAEYEGTIVGHCATFMIASIQPRRRVLGKRARTDVTDGRDSKRMVLMKS